jgi:hypothetical protein
VATSAVNFVCPVSPTQPKPETEGRYKTMPKAKKMKLRDQKPSKDPRGGVHQGPPTHGLNSVGTEGGTNKNQHHHHGGHSRF